MIASRGLLAACLWGCGFSPTLGVAVDARPADGALDAPPPGLPTSCLELHQRDASLPSASYQIDADGAGSGAPYSVQCDMDTPPGGWTLVYVADVNVVNGPVAYSVTQPVLDGATQALIAFRDLSGVAAINYATFPLPANWKLANPLNYQGNDEPVSVSLNNAAPVSTTLRYGYSNFANYCFDSWNTASTLGRVCILNTHAPFYVGFRYSLGDYCGDSTMDGLTVPCTSTRKFSIAVR